MASRFLSRQVNTLKYARNFATYNGEELFDKILIANRGEISLRVMRTAKKLGIKTVAIYSEPDINAQHVKFADEAVCVGPAASNASYLNIPNIMEAIRLTGAQAVHPGYGFLSENQLFADALAQEGIKFCGPGKFAISAMGDKIESKLLAKKANVNTIPGYVGVVNTNEDVIRISNEIGYPVMIKASAGGGGKGMRVANNDEEAVMGFRMSREEAASSFGDDRIFIEKFIEEPRHIEIQVLGDGFGNVTAFPERECSVQRRNQKVVEESPSMLLDDNTRRAMQDQAVQLAKAVNYQSAGTVEFLCDKNKEFYFLEMNTRLQVEHPVTEQITGVDLVHQMIRVASGHKLPESMQNEYVPFKGWSMESRVYAEDPLRGFLPSIGRLTSYVEPQDYKGDMSVRVDSGVQEGDEITMFYDPMICKLVTTAATRDEAIAMQCKALDEYVIRGVNHNGAFLQDVYRHPRFQRGALTTGFIAEEYPDGFSGVSLTTEETHRAVASAALLYLKQYYQASSISGALPSFQPEELSQLCVELDKEVYTVQLTNVAADQGPLSFHVSSAQDPSGTEMRLEEPQWLANGNVLSAQFNGQEASLQLLQRLPEGFQLSVCGSVCNLLVRSPLQQKYAAHMLSKPETDMSKFLVSPMPGALLSVAVEEGQEVEVGQELAVVEAMKMQNVLRAEKKGVVKLIAAQAGSTLAVDDLIIEFE